MVDMSPAAKGSKGQVIAFTHDPDEISWVSKSFADFLAASLKAFKADAEDLLLT
jgi:cell wall assembly regulator SMI1